jgi:hypothetical protein
MERPRIRDRVQKASKIFQNEGKKLKRLLRRTRLFRYKTRLFTMRLGKRILKPSIDLAIFYKSLKNKVFKSIGLKKVSLLKLLKILEYKNKKNKFFLQVFLHVKRRLNLFNKFNNFKMVAKALYYRNRMYRLFRKRRFKKRRLAYPYKKARIPFPKQLNFKLFSYSKRKIYTYKRFRFLRRARLAFIKFLFCTWSFYEKK